MDQPSFWEQFISKIELHKQLSILFVAAILAYAGYKFDRWKQARKDRENENIRLRLALSKIPGSVMDGDDALVTHSGAEAIVDSCKMDIVEHLKRHTESVDKLTQRFDSHMDDK